MAFSPVLARELCQFEIRLPPLRERRDDLPKLISAILEVVGERIGRPGLGISCKAIELLSGRAWWGNLVELMSVLESLAAFSPGLEISEAQAELVLVDSDPIVRAARERAQVEREQLLLALKTCRGNITHMAELLKVDRGTVRYRLRKYGLLPSSIRKTKDP
jgi:DNA-binding NtrC family response regulator